MRSKLSAAGFCRRRPLLPVDVQLDVLRDHSTPRVLTSHRLVSRDELVGPTELLQRLDASFESRQYIAQSSLVGHAFWTMGCSHLESFLLLRLAPARIDLELLLELARFRKHMFLVSTQRELAVRTDAKSRCTCRGRRSNCLSANYMGGRSNEEEHRSGPSRVDSDGSATRCSTQYGMMTEMRIVGELLSSRIPSTRHEKKLTAWLWGPHKRNSFACSQKHSFGQKDLKLHTSSKGCSN